MTAKLHNVVTSEKECRLSNDEPAVYVGTYGKYNDGSLFGSWIRPLDYSDKESFMEACQELHRDEEDPELMFQDWQDIPERLVGECWVSEELWEWGALDDWEKELLAAYLDVVGDNLEKESISSLMEYARDTYVGHGNSFSDVVYDFCVDTGNVDQIPEEFTNYIDWEQYSADNFLEHYFDGSYWVFFNN